MRHYTIKFGDVYLENEKERDCARICGPNDQLAIIYDAEDGVLHKHGLLENIQIRFDQMTAALRSSRSPELADALVIASFPANQEGCDLINRIIDCSGLIPAMIERGELPAATSQQIQQ